MDHRASDADRTFARDFEAGAIDAGRFDHRAHVRLGYVYLCEADVDEAAARMRRALLAFLDHLGVDRGKYHETMTGAWIRAIAHFMDRCPPCRSAEQFLDRNPKLLDPEIMLRHYSAKVLFSPSARERFTDPDIEPIPDA